MPGDSVRPTLAAEQTGRRGARDRNDDPWTDGDARAPPKLEETLRRDAEPSRQPPHGLPCTVGRQQIVRGAARLRRMRRRGLRPIAPRRRRLQEYFGGIDGSGRRLSPSDAPRRAEHAGGGIARRARDPQWNVRIGSDQPLGVQGVPDGQLEPTVLTEEAQTAARGPGARQPIDDLPGDLLRRHRLPPRPGHGIRRCQTQRRQT